MARTLGGELVAIFGFHSRGNDLHLIPRKSQDFKSAFVATSDSPVAIFNPVPGSLSSKETFNPFFCISVAV